MTTPSPSLETRIRRPPGVLRRVWILSIIGILVAAVCGRTGLVIAEDLFPYFAQYVEDDPLPPPPQPASPPRNSLPGQTSEHDGRSEVDPPAPFGESLNALPLPIDPPRNALPGKPALPRNELPTDVEQGPLGRFRRGSTTNSQEVTPGRLDAEPPWNDLPDNLDADLMELPSTDAVEVAPLPSRPLANFAGFAGFFGPEPPPVVLPHELSMLTFMDHFCCRPNPPLVLPVSGGVVHPIGGLDGWAAYACHCAAADVACTGVAGIDAANRPCWRAYGGGLVLARDGRSSRRLSFSTAAPGGSLLSTDDADWDTAGGVEFGLMRHLAGGRAVEFRYWGLYPNDRSAAAVDPAPPGGALPDLATTLDFSTLDFDNGIVIQSVDAFYDGGARHQLTRTFALHSLELNVQVPLCEGYNTARTGWLGGIRYFDFDEAFAYWSDPLNTAWGDDPANELAYMIDVENRLLGVQLGVFFEHPYTSIVHFTGNAKAGAYNNDVKYQTRVGNIATPAVVGGGVFAGRPFDLTSRSDDVAFLGEAEMGLTIDLTWQWRLAIGYKSVVLTGVALASDQIAANFNNLRQASSIDDGGTLLVHGGYARLERDW